MPCPLNPIAAFLVACAMAGLIWLIGTIVEGPTQEIDNEYDELPLLPEDGADGAPENRPNDA